MALSKQAAELVEMLTGRKVSKTAKPRNDRAQEIAAHLDLIKRGRNVEHMVVARPVENVTLSEGAMKLCKSMVEPAKSDLVKSHLAGRRITTIKNHFAVASDLAGKIQHRKRAPQTLLTETELLGATSLTVPAKTPTEDGLSDDDLRVLEQEITSGNPALAPAEASRLFADSYRVIARNPRRRLTTDSDAFGVPFVPTR